VVELGGLSAPCAGSRAEHSLCHSKSRALTVKRPRSQLAFALLSRLVPPAPNPRNDQELNLQQKESRASKDCFALALSPSRNIPLSAITRQRGLAAAARLDRFVDVSAGELLTPHCSLYSNKRYIFPQDRTAPTGSNSRGGASGRMHTCCQLTVGRCGRYEAQAAQAAGSLLKPHYAR